MNHLLRKLWRRDEGQDIAEYAVMLAVILVLVVGTIRLVGSNANTVCFRPRLLRFNDPVRMTKRAPRGLCMIGPCGGSGCLPS